MKSYRVLCLLFVVALGVVAVAADTPPKQPETGTLVVVDAAGKEQKLKAWKFMEGVRRLTWLSPVKPPEAKDAADKEKKPVPQG